MKRKPPNMREKLAATLLEVQRLRGDPIPREAAKLMTADQVCSLFAFDHYPVRVEQGGTNHPTNLDPKLILAHREKTARIDVPQIAKADRVTRRQEEFRRRLLARETQEGRPDERPAGQGRQWPKRKIAGWRRFDGTPVSGGSKP